MRSLEGSNSGGMDSSRVATAGGGKTIGSVSTRWRRRYLEDAAIGWINVMGGQLARHLMPAEFDVEQWCHGGFVVGVSLAVFEKWRFCKTRELQKRCSTSRNKETRSSREDGGCARTENSVKMKAKKDEEMVKLKGRAPSRRLVSVGYILYCTWLCPLSNRQNVRSRKVCEDCPMLLYN